MEKNRNQIQDEALEAIGSLRKAGIVASMGTGKCLLGLKHMSKYYNDNASFLVVAPRKTIQQSWIDDANRFNYAYLLNHINFSTYTSLIKHNVDDYDVVYLDECHSLKYGHKEWLMAFEKRGGIIIGFTGTYPKYANTEKGKMCNHFCPKVFEYTTDEAVADNILNDYRIFVHQLYLDGAPNIRVTGKDGNVFFTSEVKSYQYWEQRVYSANNPKDSQMIRIQRMKALQGFPSKERYAAKLLSKVTKKTLIFANTQDQADRLCKHSVHSDNKQSDVNLQLFKEGSILKLSAVEQLSQGVTIPNLETGIIMHSYGNNKQAAQKINTPVFYKPL